MDAWRTALQEKRANPRWNDIDVWAFLTTRHADRGRRRRLRRIVRIAAGFLFSETECERNFAAGRRQFDHRPKLSESAREDGLKIMVDG